MAACEVCGCRVIGHGTEAEGRSAAAPTAYCCAHCARHREEAPLQDRA
ncbi:MAG: hypothetical protein ACTMHL_06980 [Janibacter sp.]